MFEDNPKQTSRKIKRKVIELTTGKLILESETITEITPEGVTETTIEESFINRGTRMTASDIVGQCELCKEVTTKKTQIYCQCSLEICNRCAKVFENQFYCPNCFKRERNAKIILSIGNIVSAPFRKKQK